MPHVTPVVITATMWSWRFARISGIELRVHLSFLLVVVLGAMQWGGLGLRGALFGAVLTLLTFASVTLHELGHSIVAQALVVLGAIGVSLYSKEVLWDAVVNARVGQPTLVTLFAMLVLSNAVLAIFNMLPALPMDGGRVLRAVLTWFIGPAKATSAAAFLARVLAVGLLGVGLFATPANPMMVLIALFVFVGAGQEVNEQRMNQVLERVQVADVVSPYAPRFTSTTTIGEAMRMLTMTHSEAIAVEEEGRLLGVVTKDDLLKAAAALGAWGDVSSLVLRNAPVLSAHDSLETARFTMSDAGVPYVAVQREGFFLGLLTELELAVVADRLSTAKFRRDGTARVGQRQPLSR
jgi:Zn-dependent protease/CBS domain-containing protein